MNEDLSSVSKLNGEDIYLMRTSLAVKISLLKEELNQIKSQKSPFVFLDIGEEFQVKSKDELSFREENGKLLFENN